MANELEAKSEEQLREHFQRTLKDLDIVYSSLKKKLNPLDDEESGTEVKENYEGEESKEDFEDSIWMNEEGREESEANLSQEVLEEKEFSREDVNETREEEEEPSEDEKESSGENVNKVRDEELSSEGDKGTKQIADDIPLDNQLDVKEKLEDSDWNYSDDSHESEGNLMLTSLESESFSPEQKQMKRETNPKPINHFKFLSANLHGKFSEKETARIASIMREHYRVDVKYSVGKL